ncbi:NERD domain-containing protein [Bacillus sp. ISL-35]|uniref:NERD domain-containing protein n=1 Tax=Bacillus sp. ISL-35 TaxID=2819122 RepID=UPI001BE624ED|nr:NERD domain-containing protein [Bacillus sp. ISL-35]MBT2677918.1 NERD domain-containing protein [Bacillus sp. ISL-35]MBT2705499.1 NERD domain-containing protein [Chryseobacterium sp. ISL-80]
MLLKARTEPFELIGLRYLDKRMVLQSQEKYRLWTLEKGYIGEIIFDKMTENLTEERYIIDDLLLQVNNSYFQLDKVIIGKDGVYLIDIKYHEGDYYYDGDKLYTLNSKREQKNPVIQLKRSETLFRQLLQNLKMNHLVRATVVFVNPEFTLYKAPMDQPIILPTQVHRFLKELNSIPSKLDESHQKLAQTLLSLHQIKNPFSTLPNYKYEQLEKRMHCRQCGSLNTEVDHYDLVCGKCGTHERIEKAILRHIEEIKVLFPEMKITTQNVYDWCNGKVSKRTFLRVLKKNYKAVGKTKDVYFE